MMPIEELMTKVQVAFLESKNWRSFYSTVLGVQGLVRQAFPEFQERQAFFLTENYRTILLMINRLMDQPADPSDHENLRVITVRLPKSMHEALKREAHEHLTSLNRLCISKLLQPLPVTGDD